MFHGDEFIFPPYQAPPGTYWDDPVNNERWVRKKDYAPQDPEPGNARLPGNFYYYSMLSPRKTGWALSKQAEPTAYRLAAYGVLKRLGMDVYDATGEYEEQQRIMPCDVRKETKGRLPGLPCPPEGKPNIYHKYSRGGPDGFKDGVIIVLESVDDSKASND